MNAQEQIDQAWQDYDSGFDGLVTEGYKYDDIRSAFRFAWLRGYSAGLAAGEQARVKTFAEYDK